MNPSLLVCCLFYYRHWIQSGVGGMLLLLLLHLHKGAAARAPLHGEDYGYVEAYSGNDSYVEAYSGNDSYVEAYTGNHSYVEQYYIEHIIYDDDNNTEDSYEYKQDLDNINRSGGGVDSEVNTKPKYLCLLEMPLWQK